MDSRPSIGVDYRDGYLVVLSLVLTASTYVVEFAMLVAIGDVLYTQLGTSGLVRFITVPVAAGITAGCVAAVCTRAGLRRRAWLYATIVFGGSVTALLLFPVFTAGEYA